MVTTIVSVISHLNPQAGNREGKTKIARVFENSEHRWRKCGQLFKCARLWWTSYSNNHLEYEPKSKPAMTFRSGICFRFLLSSHEGIFLIEVPSDDPSLCHSDISQMVRADTSATLQAKTKEPVQCTQPGSARPGGPRLESQH